MELTLARFWSTLDDPLCSLTLHFRGVVPSPDRVLITGDWLPPHPHPLIYHTP